MMFKEKLGLVDEASIQQKGCRLTSFWWNVCRPNVCRPNVCRPNVRWRNVLVTFYMHKLPVLVESSSGLRSVMIIETGPCSDSVLDNCLSLSAQGSRFRRIWLQDTHLEIIWMGSNMLTVFMCSRYKTVCDTKPKHHSISRDRISI